MIVIDSSQPVDMQFFNFENLGILAETLKIRNTRKMQSTYPYIIHVLYDDIQNWQNKEALAKFSHTYLVVTSFLVVAEPVVDFSERLASGHEIQARPSVMRVSLDRNVVIQTKPREGVHIIPALFESVTNLVSPPSFLLPITALFGCLVACLHAFGTPCLPFSAMPPHGSATKTNVSK